MGSQDEYLRNFVVLLTEKGVVPLTDPMQIAVYNELCSGSKRPSDISAALGIPSSSLHFVLDKMTDSGVIIKAKPDPDKKSVYYSNLALKIAGSFTPDAGAAEESERTFRDPASHYSGMSSVANMLDQYSAEIGLGLDQIRRRYARDLADSMKIDVGKGNLEDVIPGIKERFARMTGFKFSVFALNPLTLVFEGESVMSSKMDMFTEFVGRAVENATGRFYTVTSVEDYCSGDSARYKVVYERAEKPSEPYINLSLRHSCDTGRFLMVELDGSVGLITSPVQIDIVDAVYERPLCVTDIVNKVEAPRSTVTSNILRMVEDGIISVFYSESGAAYYGLSCSIIMKKSRGISQDSSDIRSILSSTRSKEGAFMEGYLLYLLSYLKDLGFDTDYMMVVLGAKYMRVAGNDGPRNFDVFFGKMSGVAKAIGLSLNVVSVYPLTIGITSDDPESEMSPAMTFVKGMAHQGLEMASNGIFVRVSDDSPADRKVSFKEIYPALSMTPLEGISVEGLAEAAPAKKKRTSSVKTALQNRSAKESGRPIRTVRYITGFALVAMLAAIVVFGMSGSDQTSYADQCSISLADGCDGVAFYDDEGNMMQMPFTVTTESTVTFKVTMDESFGADDIGMVSQGIAYPLSSCLTTNDDGSFTVTVSDDITFLPIVNVEVETDGPLSYGVYSFGSKVSDSYAYGFEGYIPLDDYVEEAGGLWVTYGTVFDVTAAPGTYISTSGTGDDRFLFQRVVCDADEVTGITSAQMPRDTVEIHLEGSFEADGWFVDDVLIVQEDSTVSLKFVSTNGRVAISLVEMDGTSEDLMLSDMDRTVTFQVGDEDVVIQYKHLGIY